MSETKQELRFAGSINASQSFTITDPVALVEKYEKDWLRLAEPDGEMSTGGYQAWERFAVFVHNLMSDQAQGPSVTMKHVAEGWDDFEVDFTWNERMAEDLDSRLPEHLRTTASHPEDPEAPETGFSPGPLDQPIPGLEP